MSGGRSPPSTKAVEGARRRTPARPPALPPASSELLKNSQVLFAGYKMPHPLENRFVLRVQTREGTSPRAALEDALTSLLTQVDALHRSTEVRRPWRLRAPHTPALCYQRVNDGRRREPPCGAESVPPTGRL